MSVYSEKKCFMIVYHNASGKSYKEAKYLPCYPEDISDQTNPTWSDQTIVGRSQPVSAYTGTGFRSVSFSMTLHREMTSDKSNIEEILELIRKSVYPRYVSPGLIPPIVKFVFGTFAAAGYVTSLTYVWKKPIINNTYYLCDVQISMNCISYNIMGSNNLGSSVNPQRHKRSI